jgi:photosystem II stability/assembly factor-like uncharacterized protein
MKASPNTQSRGNNLKGRRHFANLPLAGVPITTLLTTILILGAHHNADAQAHIWQKTHTGHHLGYGEYKLEVTKKCIYIFNGNTATVIRSVNRGQTWDSLHIATDSANFYFTDISFLNDSVGYVAGYEGSPFSPGGINAVVKKTFDRGTSWTTMDAGITNSVLLTHIRFFDDQTGLVFSTGTGKTERFRTQNGGQSWTFVPDVPNPSPGIDLPSIKFSNVIGNSAVAAGFSNKLAIAFSSDNGVTWTTRRFDNSSGASALKFFSPVSGIILVNDSIFITSDGASTISTKRKFPYASNIRAFEMISTLQGFFCTDTAIYFTADAGLTWQLSYHGKSQLGKIVREGKDVFVNTVGDSLVLQLDIGSITGLSEELHHARVPVFPNPASDIVFINLDPGEKSTGLAVFDATGKLVAQAVTHPTGNLDVRMLSGGIYFLRVQTDRRMISEKLLILRE